jgi:hypothetical protein
MDMRTTPPHRLIEQVPTRRFQHRMMSMAHLDGALMRRIYVMSVNEVVTGTSTFAKNERDQTLTVAREFSPLLGLIGALIHLSSQQ